MIEPNGMSPLALSGCQSIQEILPMKRKLKINRETLRHLVDESLQDAAGGNASTSPRCIGSNYVTCTPTCARTCAFPCTIMYSVCVHCQI
jgi:hypothetical protein